jgi:hypothetical protein
VADIREFLILNPRFRPYGQESALARQAGDLRMFLRRFIARTARIPAARQLYAAAYRAHLSILLALLRRYKGTRAVYLSSGMGRGEVRYGISDIDIVVLGDWTEKSQMRLVALLAVLFFFLPLFDRESLGAIHTWQDFLHLNNTNLYLAYQYAFSRHGWKLLFGEDLVQALPPLSEDRRTGAGFLEVRRWWAAFIKMAAGQSLTARDPIFRNSLCFKAVADVLRAEQVMHGVEPAPNRRAVLETGLRDAADGALLRDLLATESAGFLTAPPGLQSATANWLLSRGSAIGTWLAQTPAFAAVAPFHVLAEAGDRMIAPATGAHADSLAAHASAWPGFRSACLLPSVQFLVPDTLALFLDCAPDQPPSVEQLRALCALHLPIAQTLPQRLRVYLSLGDQACLLDFLFGSEIWGAILRPETNPDLFTLLGRTEFVLRGTPRAPVDSARWSRLGQDLLEEELMLRRAAYARFGPVKRSGEDNLRNLWRFLQLLLMEQSMAAGAIVLPATIPATRRLLEEQLPELDPDLAELQDAMRRLHLGQVVDSNAAIERVYNRLSPLQPPITVRTKN